MFVSTVNDLAIVKCSYSEKELVKAIGDYKFNEATASWSFPLRKLVDIIDNLHVNYSAETKIVYDHLVQEKQKYHSLINQANKIKAGAFDGQILDQNENDLLAGCYEHQKKAILLASLFGSYALFLEPGLGKTLTSIRLIQYWKVPAMIVAPLSTLESVWVNEIEKWAGHLKKVILWHNIKAFDYNYDIFIINYEGFKKLISESNTPIEKKVQCLIVDECFTGNTLVDTINGTKPIEEIKKGDIVLNCLGKSKVKKIKKRYVQKNDSLVSTTIQNVDIISSKNHLFFTQRGWVKAQNLKENDYVIYTSEAMRMVQEKITEKSFKRKNLYYKKHKSFLQHILFSEMENDATRNTKKNIHRSDSEKNQHQVESFHEIGQPDSKGSNIKNTQLEFYGEPRNKKKVICNIASYALETTNSRRKRSSRSLSAKSINQSIEKEFSSDKVDTKLSNKFRERSDIPRIPDELQSRHCSAFDKVGDRSGRFQPCIDNKKKTRQEKREKVIGDRVEGVKIYKSENPIFDRYRDKRDRVVLYDLVIEGHPSFSIFGLTVHNSAKIKTHNSQITKTIVSLNHKIKHRICLSGIPAPNNLLEYFSQMKFINEDILGTNNFYKFRNTFFYSCGYGGYLYKPMKGAKEAIMDNVSKQAFSVRKEQALDLPEQVFETRLCYMDEVQKKAYETMKKENILEFKDSITLAANELAKIMKLRQVTSGWVINTQGIPVFISDTKLNILKELLEEIPEDKQVIIWLNFHFEIHRLKEEFKDTACTLYGDMTQKEKIKSIEDFQAGKYRILLAHPLSGGMGINFQQCSYVIWYSLSYSSEQYTQGNDRVHRIGQKNKCTYFHLLCKDTVDETIYNVINKKVDLIESCLSMLRGNNG